MRTSNLREDGHVVDVKETPADAKEDERGNRQPEGVHRGRIAHTEERRDDEDHAERTHLDASTLSRFHATIRQPATEHCGADGGGLPVNRRGHACDTLADVEFLLQDGWHPVPHHPRGHGGQREIQHEQDEGGIREQLTPGGDHRGPRIGRARHTRRIPEQKQERHGIQDTSEPSVIKSPAPAKVRPLVHKARKAADHHAAVDARLMHAHRPRASAAGVVVRDHCECSRDIKSLAHAHRRACPKQLLIATHLPGVPGDGRPHDEAARDGVFATEAIRDVATDGAEEGVHPFELPEHVTPVRLTADARDVLHHADLHRGDHLPVEVVQQRYGKEQRDDSPRVAARGGWIFSHEAAIEA